jgi:hypothetical protein
MEASEAEKHGRRKPMSQDEWSKEEQEQWEKENPIGNTDVVGTAIEAFWG